MRIRVRAKPRSKREGVRRLSPDLFEVRVAPPPEGGRANERIRELLAEFFKVPKSRVKLLKGETSREKLFEINP